jgi:endonuclease/exonuclease/phosphatase family metal-dependent hydrolase
VDLSVPGQHRVGTPNNLSEGGRSNSYSAILFEMTNFSVVSWNIQGKRNFTGYTSFKKVKRHLRKASPDIIALQEICDAEELLKGVENLKGYNVFIPNINRRDKNRQVGYNHNVILSKYPIIKSYEIHFPQWAKNINLENCSVADIQINNQILRIYNCHFAVFRVGIATRLKQLEYILADSNNHSGPIIICGDMNVTIPKIGWNRRIISLWHQEPKEEMSVNGKFIDGEEKEIFNEIGNRYGFKEVLSLDIPTWSPFKSKIWEMFHLKLDWFMVKNLVLTRCELGEYVSDHKAIEVHLAS